MLMLLTGAIIGSPQENKEVGMLNLAGIIALLVGFIYFLIALHRCWTVIQVAPCRTTPGKAVGFLFVPFYNFYWWFEALPGLAADVNSYIKETNQEQYKISSGISVALGILHILNWLFFGMLVPLQLILASILIHQWARFYNNVKVIPTSRTSRAPESAGSVVAVIVGVTVGGIAILGILAAIAVPAFLGQREKAKVKAVKSSAKSSVAEVQGMLDAFANGEPFLISTGTGDECWQSGSAAAKGKTCQTFYNQPGVSTYAEISDVVTAITNHHSNKGEKSPYNAQNDLFTTGAASPGQIVVTVNGSGIRIRGFANDTGNAIFDQNVTAR
jgi:type II secretory pathway pseudopilin PulG